MRLASRIQKGFKKSYTGGKLKEKMVFREASERRFHREGPIAVRDLDLTVVVLEQGTQRRGCRDVAKKGNLMDSGRYLGANLVGL